MDRAGYVYVLHFERPLSHAQHYVGCTHAPRERLCTHAKGDGARIVRAALAEGIRFKLGALGVTTLVNMRRLERQVKDWHGSGEFCECCTPDPRAIPGTRPYPLAAISFPLWSDGLAAIRPGAESRVFRMAGPDDTIARTREVAELMKAEKHALGFIPAGGDVGVTDAMVHGRMAMCLVDGKLAGYALYTISDVMRIHQVVVQDAYRECGFGRKLVEMCCASRPERTAVAKVRDDLAANAFWSAIGFRLSGFNTHETSGQRLNIYVKDGAACATK